MIGPVGRALGRLRIRAAGFAARKTIEEFDWDAQPAVRQQIAALASGGFLTEAAKVVLLGPPGTGKTHCETRGEALRGFSAPECQCRCR